MSVLSKLNDCVEKKGAGFIVLIDPDKKNDDKLEKIVSKFTPEWDNDRIAVIDMIILKMCINEFINFPSIPVKVSMNEYVEISKIYSSPESSNFINGVANNVFKYLTEKNEIKKNERGSQ